jgi:3'-phosphoadenosine 5'-phosphosulfate sulfotransferase (PAPS reductase)/FAD synthetase
VKRAIRRNPFKSLFAGTRREQYVERYVLREHKRGRAFAEILDDPYVRAWSTPHERARLLERPNVIAAVGDHAIADLRAAVAAPGLRLTRTE